MTLSETHAAVLLSVAEMLAGATVSAVVKPGNPWRVEKRGDKFVVVKADSGKVVGTHESKASAEEQIRALHANVDEGGAGEEQADFAAHEALASFEQRISGIRSALEMRLGRWDGMNNWYVKDTFEDRVIVDHNGKLRSFALTSDPQDRVVIGDATDVEVDYRPANGPTEANARITVEQMERLCAPCAAKMREAGIRSVTRQGLLERLAALNLPEGTIEALCKKWGDPGFFDGCMEWAADKGLEEGFCAALHKECTGVWPAEHEGDDE